MLVALAAQAGGRWGEAVDRLVALLLAAGLAGLVADATPSGVVRGGRVAHRHDAGSAAGCLALVVGSFFALAVRGLARTPNERILEAAKTAGTLFDSAFGMEPSFLTDMIERRYWHGGACARSGCRPGCRYWSRRICCWPPGAAAACSGWHWPPSCRCCSAGTAPWLLGLAVLIGAMLAAAPGRAREDRRRQPDAAAPARPQLPHRDPAAHAGCPARWPASGRLWP